MHARVSSHSLAALAASLLFAACGTEPSPWEPLFVPLPDSSTPLVDAGSDSGRAPSAGAGATPAPVWPEGGDTAPPPPVSSAGVGAPPGAAGRGEIPTNVAGTRALPPGPAGPSVFRISELFLRDPHVFVTAIDVTDTPVLGMSINRTAIPSQLTMDRDGDGQFDQSTLLLLAPFDPRVPMGTLRTVDARCPVGGGPCSSMPTALDASWDVDNHLQGDCLTPLAGTTGDYRTPITLPQAPCFVTKTGVDLTMNFGGTPLDITAVQISATYQAMPQQLINGLLFGFVTDAVAMRAILPTDTGPPLAGTPLGNYIRAADKDNDESPTGQPGFWIYFNFVARPVGYVE